MGYTVVVAYDGFDDLDVEREILSQVDARIDHLGHLDLPQDLARVREADALMVTTHPVRAALIAELARCRIISRMGTGIDTIDISATSTDLLALNHSTYAEKSALLNDIGLLLQTGERPPERRIPILQKIKTARGAFWRYP